MFQKIIVGMDFSAHADRAAAAAISLAKSIGHPMEVVFVNVMPPGAATLEGSGQPSIRHGIEEQLTKLVERLAADAGNAVKLNWGVVEGDPAAELATFAERWKGDLIVSGAQGKTGLASVFTGSVTNRLLHDARVPVFVVGPQTRI